MEREIANVAAACAMHGFRYLAFPPIVFDTPPIRLTPAWEEPELSKRKPEMPASVSPAAPSAQAPAPSALPAHSAPKSPPPERRFALLAEVSAQLRRSDR